MNTIGKILVILNLVLSLAVAAFLVMTFAASNNWRVAYENQAREMEVAKANAKASVKTMADQTNTSKRAEADKREAEQKLRDKEEEYKAKVTELEEKEKTQKDRADEANINNQKLLAESARLTGENKQLTGLMQERDGLIIKLQDENRKSITAKNSAEALAKATQERNESILAQLQELERKIALQTAGVGGDNRLAVDPNAPNPPSAKVKGKIVEINGEDKNLVQVNVGSDQGLKVNHTLEVYRLTPTPLYLGMIRIREAKEHSAIGRLVNTGINRSPLRQGDIVENSVSPQR